MRIQVDVGSRELLVQLKKKIAADAKEAKKEGKDKEFKQKVKQEKQQVNFF